MADKTLILLTGEDTDYIHPLKSLFRGHDAAVLNVRPGFKGEILQYCQANKFNKIVTTNGHILNLMVSPVTGSKESISDWEGSLWKEPELPGLETLFIKPLRQLYSTNHGSFVAKRWISKITNPADWPRERPFTFEIAQANNVETLYDIFKAQSMLVAIDIETGNFHDPITQEYHTFIKCVGFAGVFPTVKGLQIHSIVIPVHNVPDRSVMPFWLEWIKKFCLLPQPKVMQNGLYDSFHLMRYGSPIYNYMLDTQSMFHSWYSELPKNLAFITAFTVRDVWFWKNMGKGGNKMFEYNARDCWATACAAINLLNQLPPWAQKNFVMKFPRWVPFLACDLEGLKVDEEERQRLIVEHEGKKLASAARMSKWVGGEFNPGSPQQVKRLMTIFGGKDLESSDEKSLNKWAYRHPINAIFAEEITTYRENAKLVSTYLKPDDPKKPRDNPLTYMGRLFYGINPDGTDTGRTSSSEGPTWTGSQVQNQTDAIKTMYVPDSALWLFGEADGEQAEARCVAFLSGDKNLMEAVASALDFHKVNAARFFGMKYEDVTKAIRTIGKRTNHGANYNMGARVLVDTMGVRAIMEAGKLLGLPRHYSVLMIAEFLLKSYDNAYPTIRGPWYTHLKTLVQLKHMVTTPTGWTRYFFGDPGKSKSNLNALVAHSPQSLSSDIILEGFDAIYYQIQTQHYNHFRLKAPIHDSAFFQFHFTRLDLAFKASKLMTRTIKVKDFKGIERDLTIPIALKVGRKSWGDMLPVEEFIQKNPDIVQAQLFPDFRNR